MGTWIRGLYFSHYVRKYIPLRKIKTVLDGACGNGQYSHLIAQWAPQARVRGIDLLPVEDWKRFTLPNLSFETGDLTERQAQDSEDLIVSIDTLEHIANNEVVVVNFFNALRPAGFLYLAVPCESVELHIFPRSWFSRFHEWEVHEHIGEQRTLKKLKFTLERLGFKILLARHTFTLWGVLAWELEKLLSWGGKLSQLVNFIMTPFYKLLGLLDLYLPLGPGNNLIIAQKLEGPKNTDK